MLPLATSLAGAAYDDGLAPSDHNRLDALAVDAYTTLSHPAYPSHSVRVKKSSFCDGNVSSYTGYIDIEARHLFFYFVSEALLHLLY
jgi:hypothetical protein